MSNIIKVKDIINVKGVYNIVLEFNDVREETCYLVGVIKNTGIVMISDGEGFERTEMVGDIMDYEVEDYELDDNEGIYIGEEEVFKNLFK